MVSSYSHAIHHSHLSECFNQSLSVRHRLTRYKHWFQYPNATKYKHNTLVVAMFRDPYHWLEAMRDRPHHSPEHLRKNWTEFLTIPWTTERVGLDLESPKDARCQEDFAYNEIVSCHEKPLALEAWPEEKVGYSGIKPFYELRQDGSGEPFDNIMEMRAAKIRNFLAVKDYEGVADLWVNKYEYLLKVGTQRMLDEISELTGVPYKCMPSPPQDRPKRPLSPDFVEYVNKHLDWSAEQLIGYSKQELNHEKEEE